VDLLLSEIDSVRACAIAFIVKSEPDRELEEIMASYIAKPQYYYDVVCWLDRILYAPQPLQKYYQNNLVKNLE
jgi:hypothetical protein